MTKQVQHKLKPPSPFPAAPPGGSVRGNRPLPAGKIVKGASYTEEELKVLRQIPGWSPDQGFPSDLPDIVKQAMAEAVAEEIAPPLPLDTPPTAAPKVVDIQDLPEAQQALLAGIAASRQRIETAARAKAAAAETPNVPVHKLDLEPEPTRAELQAKPATDGSGSTIGRMPAGHCPNCNHQLDVPVPPEPDASDRQQFVLAGSTRLFRKHKSLLGGKLQVEFRELSIRELDLVYLQAQLDRKTGDLSVEDFFERMHRYRLALQIVRVAFGDESHSFPGSVEEWSNGQPTSDATSTILPRIVEEVLDAVGRESILRILGQELSEFNRLLSRLEALRRDDPFWEPAV